MYEYTNVTVNFSSWDVRREDKEDLFRYPVVRMEVVPVGGAGRWCRE
jgi:hypothetical protein